MIVATTHELELLQRVAIHVPQDELSTKLQPIVNIFLSLDGSADNGFKLLIAGKGQG